MLLSILWTHVYVLSEVHLRHGMFLPSIGFCCTLCNQYALHLFCLCYIQMNKRNTYEVILQILQKLNRQFEVQEARGWTTQRESLAIQQCLISLILKGGTSRRRWLKKLKCFSDSVGLEKGQWACGWIWRRRRWPRFPRWWWWQRARGTCGPPPWPRTASPPSAGQRHQVVEMAIGWTDMSIRKGTKEVTARVRNKDYWNIKLWDIKKDTYSHVVLLRL